MKELAKKRWFVFLLGILLAILVLLGIGVVLYCNGYRITYPQQFETSWDAVQDLRRGLEWVYLFLVRLHRLLQYGLQFVLQINKIRLLCLKKDMNCMI